MEEGLVLNRCQSGMVQEIAEHETSRFILHARLPLETICQANVVTLNDILLVVRVFHVVIIGVLLV